MRSERAHGDPLALSGQLSPDDETTYRLLPIHVPDGTTRLEIGYEWGSHGAETPTCRTVVDLGLWDPRGDKAPAGFRGWSGSRQGRIQADQEPVFVQADAAERGYRPGPVTPGTWHVELGFGAVHPDGGWWSVEVRCLTRATGPVVPPDPVDPAHVARDEPGWYRGDFHLHGYHSHPHVPNWDHVIDHARRAQLDIVPVTEYVTNAHWDELGPQQRANPDLLIWPGREAITYFGHVIALGETPSTVEYRHGFDGISLGDIQRDTVADGALFGIAHPTVFPGAALAHHCRGCELRAGDAIDWDLVDTIEVVTGPVAIDADTLGRPQPGRERKVIANPFVPTAIELWDSLLMDGHRITAVSGSDDKLGDGYGMTATMVWAEELSRRAVQAAIRAGHAYVEAKGPEASPSLAMTAVGESGRSAIFGDTLVGSEAEMTVTVRGGAGEELVVVRNGDEHLRLDITSDDFTFEFTAGRAPEAEEGPLGTYWRIETHDDVSLTALGNPIFLADQPPR
jgi:hypothetical protein